VAVQVATGRLEQGQRHVDEEDSWCNPVDSGENRQRHRKRPLTKHVERKSLQTE
jgi:hypothetical protein